MLGILQSVEFLGVYRGIGVRDLLVLGGPVSGTALAAGSSATGKTIHHPTGLFSFEQEILDDRCEVFL